MCRSQEYDFTALSGTTTEPGGRERSEQCEASRPETPDKPQMANRSRRNIYLDSVKHQLLKSKSKAGRKNCRQREAEGRGYLEEQLD